MVLPFKTVIFLSNEDINIDLLLHNLYTAPGTLGYNNRVGNVKILWNVINCDL